jgi:hypothetical protein
MMISQRAKRFSSSSFPPRIKHGVNSSGNPEFKMVPCKSRDRSDRFSDFLRVHHKLENRDSSLPAGRQGLTFQNDIVTQFLEGEGGMGGEFNEREWNKGYSVHSMPFVLFYFFVIPQLWGRKDSLTCNSAL